LLRLFTLGTCRNLRPPVVRERAKRHLYFRTTADIIPPMRAGKLTVLAFLSATRGLSPTQLGISLTLETIF
jgi:hypothetical protein